MTHSSPDPGITVSVPKHWATRSDTEHGIVVAARSRELPPSGFAPEIVVRTTLVDAPDLTTWRLEALTSMTTQLDAFDLEDEDLFDLADHPAAYRRFSHRLATVDVVCEQWSWLVDAVGVTLTGSVARRDYATYCDLFEEVAATIEVAPPAAA